MRCGTAGLLVLSLAGMALAVEPEYGFGGGGPGLGLFMPDLTAIETFVEGAGFPSFDGDPFLIGGGGRGGLIPGLAFGGAGWGAWIESRQGNLKADFGVGLGGFDLGFAVGGDERSVLTLGGVIGGGGAELVLTEHPVAVPVGRTPRGIIVEPTQQIYDSAFAFIAPYVDIQIQLLGWMGLDVRAGYVLTLFELNWQDKGTLDPPSLAPPGPFVQFSIVFGGIGKIESEPLDDAALTP